MARKLQLPASKTKAAHIDGEQFLYGLGQIDMAPDRFAALFCNGRLSRVHEWLNGEVHVPPWGACLAGRDDDAGGEGAGDCNGRAPSGHFCSLR